MPKSKKETMKLRTLFTFLFLAVCFTEAFAQSNFRRGFIITNEQDTVSGWIDFRTDARNMQVCDFRSTRIGRTQTFLPGEIYGYRFYEEGKFYVSREIVIDGEPRIVFLEFMVQGMMNLFFYIDTSTFGGLPVEYYFFEDQTGRMIPMQRQPYRLVKIDEGPSVMRQDLRYRGIARYLFHQHETIAEQTDELEFNHFAMINLVREYHDLTCLIGEECIVFETTKNQNFNKFQFSIYGGTLSLASRNNFMNYSINSTAPMIGARMNLFAPRIDNNLSFQIDLGFARMNDVRVLQNVETAIEQYVLPLQLGIRYAFFGKYRVRPTLGTGVSIAWIYEIRETRLGGVDPFSEMLGFCYISAGLEFHLNNRLAIFADAEYMPNIFGVMGISNDAHAMNFMQLKLGFRF